MTIKVVLFSASFDIGGQGYRIKRAFDKYQKGFEVRSIHTVNSYYDFPKDLTTADSERMYDLFTKADIYHMRLGFEGLKRLAAKRGADARPAGMVVHHHGSKFRANYQRLLEEARVHGATQLVSTIDLTIYDESLIWLPTPHDLDYLMSFKETATRAPNGKVRICHAPTNREVKSTAAVLTSIETLYARGLPIELDLVERSSWQTVLGKKAKADIYVDQVKLGYGNNAVEAWAMGIPVIAGVESSIVRAAMIERWGYLPFYEATEGTLPQAIEALATDSGLRSHWGTVGRRFVEQYHDDWIVAEQLASIYQKIIASQGGLSG